MMKQIPYVLLLPLTLIILFTQCKKEPEPEPEKTIPDINFLNALIDRGIDTNGDGLISDWEAEAVHNLDVSDCGIWVIEGIEMFVNLEILNCRNNHIT